MSWILQIILKAKEDALHLKEVFEVYIVSLVERKAVNNNVDEPQNPEGVEKELRDAQQVWGWFYVAFSDVYSVLFRFFTDNIDA